MNLLLLASSENLRVISGFVASRNMPVSDPDNAPDDSTLVTSKGEEVAVVYVHRKDAKQIKDQLEHDDRLNKNFRMTSAVKNDDATTGPWDNCIAVPIIALKEDMGSLQDDVGVISGILRHGEGGRIVGTGVQFCPYSSSVLGSSSSRRRQGVSQSSCCKPLTTTQTALLETARDHSNESEDTTLLEQILALDTASCPKTLEMFGDDNTLIIPRKALNKNIQGFREFLQNIGVIEKSEDRFMTDLWKNLARLYKSPRIVRKCEIDPNSPVRESGCRLLWSSSSARSYSHNSPFSYEGGTGPSSPTWITVTEQGIKQSFDMAHVMFSRGNITEKIRFGKQLVQEGEVVLDMYGGIGYFTLPALIHGRSQHVYVCEWNPHAVEALKYNLKQNGVENRATVLVGDCRVVAEEQNLRNMFDRVSLGLLPSSEGGWETAVRALRRDKGGWLHVHGNVSFKEAGTWCKWLCIRLKEYVQAEEGLHSRWVIVCRHLEKVKSFAPTVNHYVADVYLGPPSGLRPPLSEAGAAALEPGSAAICRSYLLPSSIDDERSRFELCPDTIEPPSCALSPTGALHQAWMR